MREGGLEEAGCEVLDVELIAPPFLCGAQRLGDLAVLHNAEHVRQDGGMLGEACRNHERRYKWFVIKTYIMI